MIQMQTSLDVADNSGARRVEMIMPIGGSTGKIASLGNDAVIEEPTSEDVSWLHDLLHQYNLSSQNSFKKVVSGKKLWNFDRKEREVWKAAL